MGVSFAYGLNEKEEPPGTASSDVSRAWALTPSGGLCEARSRDS